MSLGENSMTNDAVRSRARTAASEVDDEAVRAALRHLRECEGTAYARDLIPILWGPAAATTAEREARILPELNRWGLELVLQDRTRETTRTGMTEYVTNPEVRAIVDALAYEDGASYRFHPGAVTVVRKGGRVVVDRAIPDAVVAVLDSPACAAHPQLAEARDAFRRYAEQPLVLAVATAASVRRTLIERHEPGTPLVVDLAGTYTEDFDLAEVLADLPTALQADAGAHGVRVVCRVAVVAGRRASFRATMGPASWTFDFERTIFTVSELSFDGSHSVSPRVQGRRSSSITFRDAAFADSVGSIGFVGSDLGGFDLSFEDATIARAHMSFDGAAFADCGLFLYQLAAAPASTISFVGTRMEGVQLDLSDAVVGSLLFYDVGPLPAADFSFRRCEVLALENCSLTGSMKISSVQRLSLAGSHLNGLVLYVVERAGARGAASKAWLLDALERHGRRRGSIADELAALKEVFHGMGEYDLEDDAFVRYMRHIPRRGIMRLLLPLLDVVGRFGTDPRRILGVLAVVLLVFWAVNTALLALAPDAFSGDIAGSPLVIDALLFTLSAFVQAVSPIEPTTAATVTVALVQTMAGWFFLGYFFVAFTRRTLR